MANIKTVQERNELHKTIWNIADELRGSVGGLEFKNYVLGTMFYRYISERITYHINKTEWDAGNKDFDYAKLSELLTCIGSVGKIQVNKDYALTGASGPFCYRLLEFWANMVSKV